MLVVRKLEVKCFDQVQVQVQEMEEERHEETESLQTEHGEMYRYVQ